MNLTDEQKRELRIKVAELCGYIKYRDYGDGHWKSPNGYDFLVNELPDYPNSLDAMAEAEQLLSNERYDYKFGTDIYDSSQREDYYHLLMFGSPPCFMCDGCGKYDDMPNPPPNRPELAGKIFATATQRATAFVAVMEGRS